jgi:DNA-binding transcriptional ArsR family regulator
MLYLQRVRCAINRDEYHTINDVIYHYVVQIQNVIIFTIKPIHVYTYIKSKVIMVTPSLTQEITQLHADICSGLADPKRILILYALAEQTRNVSEVAQDVGISQPAASRHLNILRERGMVSAKREGQAVVYMLADVRIIQALDLLRAVLGDNLRSRGALAQTVLESQ